MEEVGTWREYEVGRRDRKGEEGRREDEWKREKRGKGGNLQSTRDKRICINPLVCKVKKLSSKFTASVTFKQLRNSYIS